ncbi:hypothetical protein J2S43_003732 [Catenuloplanes nepalensis]|uniref:Uncharacterized protein n=1 Tax=Catenuloplanes nepalensis TaxID=587533 RepID=A0ABT9MUW8_9ACTN|nr:hypothetical protein [Catenuloplanes nepalensis]MDP9795220.1 hypothetical protein [Catenuloplanes nepalensis]
MAPVPTNRLTMTLDGVDVTPQVSRAVVTSEETDRDFISFADAAAGGGRDYNLELTYVQDLADGSVWDLVWSHAGEEVDVVVRPFGNLTPTPTQPHFIGTVVISEGDTDLIGGEADASATARFTSEATWAFVAKPTKVTA